MSGRKTQPGPIGRPDDWFGMLGPLAAGRQPTTSPEGDSQPKGKAPDLLRWGRANLVGKERRLVELVCDENVSHRLADLAVTLGWDNKDDDFNKTARRVNPKVWRAGLAWHIHRRNGEAVLSQTEPKARLAALEKRRRTRRSPAKKRGSKTS
jgi:hypothetical protein